MKNKELIPILAEIWGVPFERAWTIDRSLANAGFRRKWKGPNPPDMTREEAVNFLLACMIADKATQAGDELKPWSEARGWLTDKQPSFEDDLAAVGTLDGPVSEEMFEAAAEDDAAAEIVIHTLGMRKLLGRLRFGSKASDALQSIGLIDCLMALAACLQSNPTLSDDVRFEVSHTGWASVSIAGWDGQSSRIEFFAEDDRDPSAQEAQISRVSSVHGDALLALAIRTPDPLTEVGTTK